MVDRFALDFFETGMFQFGQFKSGNDITPFRFNVEYLPTYPKLLTQLATLASDKAIQSQVDRLISVDESLPLGIACAMQSGLSLAYFKQWQSLFNRNLIGPYDSGHRAALLLNQFDKNAALSNTIGDSEKAGLRIVAGIVILAISEIAIAGIPIYPLFRLREIIAQLCDTGRLPNRQAEVTLNWIERQ